MQCYCWLHLCCSRPAFSHRGGEAINVRAVDRPLKEVISQLEKDYGYRFIFRDDALDMEKKVTVSFEDASINAVLDSILGP